MTDAALHETFVVERDLPGRPAHAFRFWSEAALKRKWNSCHPDWEVLEDVFDFRVGGREVMRWRIAEGTEQEVRSHYLSISPARRIIYAYTMRVGTLQVSASLATVEFAGVGSGTRMTFTEQAAFLDGGGAAARRGGTETGFERLSAVLEAELSSVH
jgi:uncharacterized protein YndB with AHSA1/START domain